jgi:uncharacterized protein YegP (UPF0339 family)
VKIQVYRRITLRGWRWFWRFVHSNGNVMADGSEAYNARGGAIIGLSTVSRELPHAEIQILDDFGKVVDTFQPDRAVPHAELQIEKLAEFILNEIPGEPSASESAVDTAIRLLRHSYVGPI